MQLRIGRRGRPFLLVGKREDREKLNLIPLRDEKDARRWLTSSLMDPAELDAIRVWWHGQGGMLRRNSDELFGDVAQAAVEGRIAYAEIDGKPEEDEEEGEKDAKGKGKDRASPGGGARGGRAKGRRGRG